MRRALLVIAALILLLPLRAGAEGVSDMYGALPDGVRDSLPDRLENDISENGESAVASLGAEYIASLAASALKAAFAYSVKPLAAVIGVQQCRSGGCGRGGCRTVVCRFGDRHDFRGDNAAF